MKYDAKTMESMKIKLDYNYMMEQFVEGGITSSEIRNLEKKIAATFDAVVQKRSQGKLDFMDLPHNQREIVKEIQEYTAQHKDNIDAFVVLGIGGSALGPMAVQQAINSPYYNELPRERRGNNPRFYVVDNVDPEKLIYLFQIIDVEKCLFNVISKSGSTSETMSQFMIIKQMLEDKLGNKAKDHIVCTTDSETGNLIKIAKEEGYKTFYIPRGVGGRFSQLTPVGLLPAAFCGINLEDLLEGAAYMDLLCKSANPGENLALMYAVLNYISMEKGKNICVLMPYADSLKLVSDWYAQIWAESLGKKYNNQDQVVNLGPTPVKALGATDQHSQVQLYTEGPYDKIIVLMGVEEYRETITIPNIYKDMPSLGFLGGHTHNKLIQVEQAATEYALQISNRPNMTITLPKVNEFTLGQVIYFFELATAYMGELLNINAFDQPGVEEGKNATYAMFDRPGYEEKKKEMLGGKQKSENYII